MQIMPNRGILFNDSLDKLRGDAIVACQDGLPEALVYYLRALETSYLGMLHEQHKRSASDIGWKHIADPSPSGKGEP